jgi:hypothetical protein
LRPATIMELCQNKLPVFPCIAITSWEAIIEVLA